MMQWGLFDLAENPLPTFHRGRICVAGDAAHASTPHHGAGAGFCVEDAAVLSSLLDVQRAQSPRDLAIVFAAFDHCRRDRAQWLVRSSREAAELYEWRAPGVGGHCDEQIQGEIRRRQEYIWNLDLDEMIRDAREDLGARLATVPISSSVP